MCEGKLPYPLDERGVPVKPVGLDECYDVCLNGIKTTNRHHLAFERRRYRTPIERNYRENGNMVVKACVCKHADLHSTYLPPKKPDAHTMCDIAQGDIAPTEAVVFIRTKEQVNMENVS